ncbi:DNA-directed RNA polymerases I and III subunit RPAC2 [Perkinsus chesapeaki]|uniref:Sugar transporter SWEET1 n=1 Tax=Perkinsus chesapeaki TaxID=330153 RepID=A0A7J6LEW2_PERCH|nr:DNA-directed RNA polymerases I and III subunit RPAC2 [Perkinsus chesapeaki]
MEAAVTSSTVAAMANATLSAASATAGSSLLSAGSIAAILGSVGSVVSFCQFFTAVPTFVGIVRKHSTENLSSLPYCASALLSVMWVSYALITPGRNSILFINALSSCVFVTYMLIFLRYAVQKRTTVLYYLGLVLCYLLIMYCSLFLSHDASATLGTFCVVVNIVMYASPLAVLKTIIQTKDSSCMPPLYSLGGWLAAMVWFGYGFFTGDMHIMIPNAAGVVLGAAQMIIWYIYRVPKDKKSNKRVRLSSADVDAADDVKPGHHVVHHVESESTVCSVDYLQLDP